MQIYLDTCSLQRPFDDTTHLRIHLEAEAVLAILTLCARGILTLVSSDILAFEIDRNPHPQRKAFAQALIHQARHTISLTPSIIHRAQALEQEGIPALDALHLASAEAAAVAYFCTCDDRFYKKAKALSDIPITVVTPLELVQEVTI